MGSMPDRKPLLVPSAPELEGASVVVEGIHGHLQQVVRIPEVRPPTIVPPIDRCQRE